MRSVKANIRHNPITAETVERISTILVELLLLWKDARPEREALLMHSEECPVVGYAIRGMRRFYGKEERILYVR